MTNSNIEKFNELVGIIFAKLYESFPLKRDLFTDDILGKEFLASNSQEIGTSAEDEIFFLDSIDWLLMSGYIVGARSSGGCHNVVLTAKGLEVLKAVPQSLNSPLGERIVAAVNAEGRKALSSLVSQALGLGLQYAIRSI
ncbi:MULTISPECIES: hypothetical protein [Brenneria]|uniref:DUF2513 domain-containing protein n=1 Tax=Brenneria nigrifluens DSM 30175 = ATCC 13028 TaxID=1121120 RepID=A0A2U1UWF6_9GAMM|nr:MULTISPECIES: hypothetical protein [Brenneria]EHD22630.1 hypothetical protein BrE312_3265 [Brenneria sp. EniD312]PWC26003.1 hypothetical protein DDT54_01370 [Brenneria nigrifluens DSM 30175 = ATCC 13028]QCR05615.1 hypothetical protein EH206_16350 [Brenneria nigrifluens DSM 30175 = ATCC 13028]